MNPLQWSAGAGYALLGGVALFTVLFYLLRSPARRVTVPSLLIWARLGAVHHRKAYGLRWWLSLLLALAVGLLIALALLRPQLRAIGGLASQTVLVLDNSPSMAARTADGRSRWLHAADRARAQIRGAGLASRFMVLDTMGYARISGWVAADAALAAVDRLYPVRQGTPRMPALAASGPGTRVILFTDGVAPLDTGASVAVESVFERATNFGITAFEVRPQPGDGRRYQGYVQVRNAGAVAQKVTVELKGGERWMKSESLEVPPGTIRDLVLDVSDYEGGPIRAAVKADGDAFEADDAAWAVVAPHARRRLLLVTAGNARLEEVVRLLPGLEVKVMRPAAWRGASAADVCIFDRFAPPAAPDCAALLFQAPRASWLPPAIGGAGKATPSRWNAADPLAGAIAWRDVQWPRAQLTRPEGAATDRRGIVFARGTGGEGALVSTGAAARRWIDAGFGVQEGNLGFKTGFPVFVAESLAWLAEGDAVLARGAGAVEVPDTAGQISDLEGRPVDAVKTASGLAFQAERPGVYTWRDGNRTARIVVNLLDAGYGDINRSRFAATAPPPVAAPAGRHVAVKPWMLLLLLAVVLMSVEWIGYTRRWTE